MASEKLRRDGILFLSASDWLSYAVMVCATQTMLLRILHHELPRTKLSRRSPQPLTQKLPYEIHMDMEIHTPIRKINRR